jgi:hypothetical protein
MFATATGGGDDRLLSGRAQPLYLQHHFRPNPGDVLRSTVERTLQLRTTGRSSGAGSAGETRLIMGVFFEQRRNQEFVFEKTARTGEVKLALCGVGRVPAHDGSELR